MEEGQDKKTFMAIGLIMLVTFAWIYLSPKSPAPPQKAASKAEKAEKVEKVKERDSSAEKETEQSQLRNVQRKQVPEMLSRFDNEFYSVTFSNHGATIKGIELKKYRTALKKDSSPVRMLNFDRPSTLWKFDLDKMEFNSNIPFDQISKDENSITYKGQLIDSEGAKSPGAGINVADITVTYTMDPKDYQLAQVVEIINKTEENMTCSATMNLLGRANDVEGGSFGLFSAREEPMKAIYNLNDKIEREVLQKQAKENESYTGDIKWLGFNDKYFMTALLPDAPSIRDFDFIDRRDDIAFFRDDNLVRRAKISGIDGKMLSINETVPMEMQTASYRIERKGDPILIGSNPVIVEESSGCFSKKQSLVVDLPGDVNLVDNLFAAHIEYPPRKLNAGEKLEYRSRIFAGPKEISVLKSAGRQMDRAIDLGDWIGPISRPLLYFLKWIYSLIPNYGIAIILLTLIVRGLLYPLTKMQNKSMKKMQLLKPEMDKLKAKYGKDKETLNREMMKLWKIHKVNPMGGCFPLLLQLPIFFALYRVLYNSIELRHEPFIFWIKDLSNYDPYFVTPVLMGISFYLQQRIMPQTSMDAAQQKMMKVMMPVMFTMLMLFLPSGLVLYIFVSTLLGIVQQYINMRSKQDSPVKA